MGIITPQAKQTIAIFDMDNLKNPFWGAGQARATREVWKRLSGKYDVTVYCSKYPGYKDYREDGIQYVHIGINSSNSQLVNMAFICAIPIKAAQLQVDCIIENFNAPTSVSFLPLFTKIPVIAIPTMFNAIEFTKKYHIPFHLIEAWGLKYYRYMTPYSEVDSAKIAKLNPTITYKIIPQGVGEEFFAIPHEKPKHILFLGRFDIWQKGIDFLLEAYAKVADRIGYPLILAGHGPDEEKIKKMIKDLNIADKVTIVGSAYGQKKIDLISESLFVAFPSRHDELSLWALEALGSGMPIAAFDLPEAKWMPNTVSLKAKPFDTEEYGECLVRLTEEEKNSSMRQAAREFARGFSWDTVAREFDTFIQDVINKNK